MSMSLRFKSHAGRSNEALRKAEHLVLEFPILVLAEKCRSHAGQSIGL
jgi:hypothetical protein